VVSCPAEFRSFFTTVDANLTLTCERNGGIKTVAGTGTTSSAMAMAMTGMVAFVVAAALVF
jgi:hypothetical protein